MAAAHKTLDRVWEAVNSPAGTGNPRDTEPFAFTVATYNVLSQDAICDTAYLYNHCKPRQLEWSNRWRLIQNELDNLNADVLCLQEVQLDLYEQYFLPHMQGYGYGGSFKKRTAKSDGCATFWRQDKFECVQQRAIEYFVPDTSVLDKDDIALLLALKPTSGSAGKLIVANTHLCYNPKRGDIKLAQTAMLLAHCDKMRNGLKNYPNNPLLLCGDLNTEPSSPLYQFYKSGRLDYVGLPQHQISGQGNQGGRKMPYELLPANGTVNDNCLLIDHNTRYNSLGTGSLSHGHKLQSVYSHVTSGQGKEISSYHRDPSAVDYIFHSMGRLECKERLSLPSKSKLDKSIGRLPNDAAGSDHLPLMARFLWHA